MVFKEIDLLRHKFWLSAEFLKVHMQKKQKKTKKTRGDTFICQLLQGLPYTEGRWSKYYSPTDGDIDYFYIVAIVLQGDILAPYIFIILSRLRA